MPIGRRSLDRVDKDQLDASEQMRDVDTQGVQISHADVFDEGGGGTRGVVAEQLLRGLALGPGVDVGELHLLGVDDLEPGLQGAEEEVRLAAGAQRSTGAEQRIERPDAFEHGSPQGKVGSDPPVAIGWRIGTAPLALDGLEAGGEALALLRRYGTRPHTTAASGSCSNRLAIWNTQSGGTRQSSSVKAMTSPLLSCIPRLRPLVTPRCALRT